MTLYMQNRVSNRLKDVKRGRNKLRVFYLGVSIFLGIVVMLVAMSATNVKAMEYVQPRPVVTVEEYEIPFDITPSVEERLLNVAKYCTTDGALEEFGSTSHCNEYYLLMIESDR